MKYTFLLFCTLLLLPAAPDAQLKIGDNRQVIDPSAILEVESTTKGFMPPRITTARRDAMVNPAPGLLIYNESLQCLQVQTGNSSSPVWLTLLPGFTQPSTFGTAVVSSYSCTSGSTGNLVAGQAVSGVTQTLTANVTAPGTYHITSTAGGVTFSGSGVFSGTGSQSIVLTAAGVPLQGGNQSFVLPTTPSCSFSRSIALASGGTAVISSLVSCATSMAGFLAVGTAASGVTQTVTVNVGTAGTYQISTPVVNGISFSASGSFAATGQQAVVLTASGTPDSAGAVSFSLPGLGCSFSRRVGATPGQRRRHL